MTVRDVRQAVSAAWDFSVVILVMMQVFLVPVIREMRYLIGLTDAKPRPKLA